MRSITEIILHCSASPNGRWTTVADIDRWHRERGFRRDPAWQPRCNPALTSIGYHHVIYTNGAIATGRHHEETGAHARGYNANSIGVCLIGTDKFTAAQWQALKGLLEALKKLYPRAEVRGHNELPGVTKTCPGFSVAAWLLDMLHVSDYLLASAP